MSALVAAGTVELVIELAIGRQDRAAPWDEATWGDNVWAHTDESLGDWVDVTCSVLDESLALAAGADTGEGAVTRWTAATAALTLVGSQWNPWAGAYAGILGPNTPARVRWRRAGIGPFDDTPAAGDLTHSRARGETVIDAEGEWVVAFVGGVDDEGWTWTPARDPARSTAAVALTDNTSALAAFDAPEQPEQGRGETASARVTRILDFAYWPGEDRDITPGGITLKATTLADAAWTLLLQVSDTDLALLWLRRDGKLAYRPRGRVEPPEAIAALLVPCLTDNADRVAGYGDFRVGPRVLADWSMGFYIGEGAGIRRLDYVPDVGLRMTEPAGGITHLTLHPAYPQPFILGRHVFRTEPGQEWVVTARVRSTMGRRFNLLVMFGSTPADVFQLGPIVTWVDTIVDLVADEWTTLTARVRTPTGRHYFSTTIRPYIQRADDPGDWTWDAAGVEIRPPGNPSEIQYVTYTGSQPNIVRNIVSVSRQAPDDDEDANTVTVRDEASISRFRPHTYTRTDLIHDDDDWTPILAGAILAGGAWPSPAPTDVVLSSRTGDRRAAALLLGIEFDQGLTVSDGQTEWRVAPIGWDVTISRAEIAGTLRVLDVGGWVAGRWGSAQWSLDTWGV